MATTRSTHSKSKKNPRGILKKPVKRMTDPPIRTADDKGRLNLGQKFANKTFLVKPGADSTEFILTIGRVIPERELWLYQNPKAMESVQTGLQQAQAGQFSQSPPDIKVDSEELDEEAEDE